MQIAVWRERPKPERLEETVWTVKLTKEMAKEYEEQVKILADSFKVQPIGPNQILTIQGSIFFSYYNKVTAILKALREIATHVETVSITELKYGECLLLETLQELQKLQKLIYEQNRTVAQGRDSPGEQVRQS